MREDIPRAQTSLPHRMDGEGIDFNMGRPDTAMGYMLRAGEGDLCSGASPVARSINPILTSSDSPTPPAISPAPFVPQTARCIRQSKDVLLQYPMPQAQQLPLAYAANIVPMPFPMAEVVGSARAMRRVDFRKMQRVQFPVKASPLVTQV